MVRMVLKTVLLALFSANVAHSREWRSSDTGKTVDATFIRLEDTRAILRRTSNSKLYSVSLDALSVRDRRFIRSQLTGGEQISLPRQYPTHISRFELPTSHDLYYTRVVQRAHDFADRHFEKWPMLREAKSELGELIGNALDAKELAAHLAKTCSADQTDSPLTPIRELVEDCSRILGINPPHVRIKNDRSPQLHVFGIEEKFLVINSGLLELFEDSPDELRFVLGRELGHVKCHHIEMQKAGKATVELLSAAAPMLLTKLRVPGKSNPVAPFLLGQYLSWVRESEFTSDRAGLLCCQDIDIATEALYRLQHGIRKGSRYYDSAKKVNVDTVLKELEYWENKPFIEILLQLNASTHPFVEQRMAMLRSWHDASLMDDILDRNDTIPEDDGFLTIDRIGVASFSRPESALSVYLVSYVGETKWFQSPTQSKRTSAIWSDFPSAMRVRQGQPIFFELWEDRTLSDKLIGMFVIFPQQHQTDYQASFRLDVERRQKEKWEAIPKAVVKASLAAIQSHRGDSK